jgi:hypothetical protein
MMSQENILVNESLSFIGQKTRAKRGREDCRLLFFIFSESIVLHRDPLSSQGSRFTHGFRGAYLHFRGGYDIVKVSSEYPRQRVIPKTKLHYTGEFYFYGKI